MATDITTVIANALDIVADMVVGFLLTSLCPQFDSQLAHQMGGGYSDVGLAVMYYDCCQIYPILMQGLLETCKTMDIWVST